MLKAIATAAMLVIPMSIAAQSRVPPPAKSTDFTGAEQQLILKAYPGARSTQAKAVDVGKHIIALYVDQVLPGAQARDPIMHAEVTEVYVIVEGSGTVVTGGKLINPTATEVVPGGAGITATPHFSGKAEGGQARRVSAGDVVINPPGTVHTWQSVDGPRLVYLTFWIDPEKKIPSTYLDKVLKAN